MPFLWCLAFSCLTGPAAAPLPAFPGAEGFGAATSGGRGGKTHFVTTLENYLPGKEKPISGSLRAAIEDEGPRFVLFRVSGTIELKAKLAIRSPRITLAGQSAPGDGVCLKNWPLLIETNDAVLRHVRIRPGDAMKQEIYLADCQAMTLTNLTNHLADEAAPSGDAAADRVAFERQQAVWILDRGQESARMAPHGEGGFAPRLSSDGKRLLFLKRSPEGIQLYLVPLD